MELKKPLIRVADLDKTIELIQQIYSIIFLTKNQVNTGFGGGFQYSIKVLKLGA